MTDSATILESARISYNSYIRDVVGPSSGLTKAEEDRLTDAEIAERISDGSARREFVVRAIALYQANVNYHKDLATPKVPERDRSTPVIASLLAAAAGFNYGGPVAALLAAAAGFWLGYRYVVARYRDQVGEADAHNALVPEWQQSIDKWNLSIRELRALQD